MYRVRAKAPHYRCPRGGAASRAVGAGRGSATRSPSTASQHLKPSPDRNMFRASRILLCATVMLGYFVSKSFAQMKSLEKQVISLDQGWKFRQRGVQPGAVAAGGFRRRCPGDVHLDLLRHQLIPDPFFRDNEAKLQWISQADWEYRTTLPATPELLQAGGSSWCSRGWTLTAKCTSTINGCSPRTTCFALWRVDAKPWLKSGANRILVVFPAPDPAAEKVAQAIPGGRGPAWRPRPTSARPPTSTAGTGARRLSPAASGGRQDRSLG